MACAVIGVHQHRIAPGGTVIGTYAHRKRKIQPVSGIAYSIHMKNLAIRKMAEGAAGHIAVGHFEEGGCLLPLSSSFAQARAHYLHFAAIFIDRSKPDGQKVAVVAPGDCRLVVMRIEGGFVGGLHHERDGFQEEGGGRCRSPVMLFLRHIAHIGRSSRRGLRIRELRIAFYHPETDLTMVIIRGCRHTVGATEIFHGSIVTASAGNLERALRRTSRIGLGGGRIRTVPILAPFLHISVHIVKPE